jgi:hypothetical protein
VCVLSDNARPARATPSIPAIRKDVLTHGLITGGVDTHRDNHVAAALDERGAQLGIASFPTTPAGYRQLHAWLTSFGPISKVGVEGTGTWGLGLARHLNNAGVQVLDVDRPNRQNRRRRGKSDPTDAVAAARAALSGEASTIAKTRDGDVEAIRLLRVARTSARADRRRALNQLRSLVATGPDELRQHCRDLTPRQLVDTAAAFRPGTGPGIVWAAKTSMRSLARRILDLEQEVDRIDEVLHPLVTAAAPELVARHGIGPDTAGALLVAAGENHDRLRHEAAFAHLCGVAPIEASSGIVERHRLNRGGNREANSALWRIVLIRMRSDPRTRAYVSRRLAEGKSKREIMRCLKRYVAREIFNNLPIDTLRKLPSTG